MVAFIEDSGIETLAISGSTIKYNPKFFSSLSSNEQEASIVHELLHRLLKHNTRAFGRVPHLWNDACDYRINSILNSSGYVLPTGALYSKEFDFKSEDEIYHILCTRFHQKLVDSFKV